MNQIEILKSMFAVSDALKDCSYEMAISILCTAIDEQIAKHGKDPNEEYEYLSKMGKAVNEEMGVLDVR